MLAAWLGIAGLDQAEDLDTSSLSARLSGSSIDWLAHPAWGVAFLALIAAAWCAYRRYADMRRMTVKYGQALQRSQSCLDSGAASGGAELLQENGTAIPIRPLACHEHRSLNSRNDGAPWAGMLADGGRGMEVRDAGEVLHHAEGAVDYALLSAISHDVRTPLTGILGALELLEYSELTEQQRALLRSAEGASRTLQGILDDVLALAKLEAGMAPREHRAFDPGEVVRMALSTVDDGEDFAIVLDERLKRRLLGDGTGLGQVLAKLATYALSRKLGKPWRFEARVLAEGTSWQSVEFVLEVRQAGQADASPSSLPMDARRSNEFAWIAACKLCEWMGLSLQEQGRGWTEPCFVLRGCFSLVPGVSSEEQDEGASNSLGLPREGRAVLVVEDHELVREVIGHQLATLGWSCDLVGDGGSALQALAARDYALVITDRYMPGMDGLELARRIRSEEANARLPIVLLTANLPENEQEAVHAFGIGEVIRKPTSVPMLSRVLAKWASSHRDPDPEADRFAAQVADDARQVVGRLRTVFGDDVNAVWDYLHLLSNEQGRLRIRLGEGDTDGLREVAHSLSGVASFFGAQGLTGMATLVERGESAITVLAHADELGTYLAQLIASLQTNACEFAAIHNDTSHVSDGSHRKVSGAALEI